MWRTWGLMGTRRMDLEELDKTRGAFQARDEAGGKNYLDHLDSLQIFQTAGNYICGEKNQSI